MMRLHDRIAALIRAEGPLRFDRFMEAALYDPEGGYYEREGRVGRGGDFVTGPSWHPAFGRTMARIARRLRDEEGEKKISAKGEEGLPSGLRAATDVMDIVDVGAGVGHPRGIPPRRRRKVRDPSPHRRRTMPGCGVGPILRRNPPCPRPDRGLRAVRCAPGEGAFLRR